ncbi:hypothetical protein AAFC00_002879 [Neodothiora populina]|uniref:Uncharacterized protein n=1 Tax=Neodothiora populina TaxID=2781224 RepID=A0ABR3P8J9_9PEZI
MPTLRQLTCSIELGSTDLKLDEFGTRYGDGHVETYVAVPYEDISFSIHLTSKGYVAPGIAFFVFIDGQYQCNRNRRGLLVPEHNTPSKQYEIDLRARQKETKQPDGSFIGRDWTFHELNTGNVQKAQHVSTTFLDNVGTIEVVVLRCKENPAPEPLLKDAHARKSAQQAPCVAVKRSASPPQVAEVSKADAPQKTSSTLGGFMGLFDGAADNSDLDDWPTMKCPPGTGYTYNYARRVDPDHKDVPHKRQTTPKPWHLPSDPIVAHYGPIPQVQTILSNTPESEDHYSGRERVRRDVKSTPLHGATSPCPPRQTRFHAMPDQHAENLGGYAYPVGSPFVACYPNGYPLNSGHAAPPAGGEPQYYPYAYPAEAYQFDRPFTNQRFYAHEASAPPPAQGPPGAHHHHAPKTSRAGRERVGKSLDERQNPDVGSLPPSPRWSKAGRAHGHSAYNDAQHDTAAAGRWQMRDWSDTPTSSEDKKPHDTTSYHPDNRSTSKSGKSGSSHNGLSSPRDSAKQDSGVKSAAYQSPWDDNDAAQNQVQSNDRGKVISSDQQDGWSWNVNNKPSEKAEAWDDQQRSHCASHTSPPNEQDKKDTSKKSSGAASGWAEAAPEAWNSENKSAEHVEVTQPFTWETTSKKGSVKQSSHTKSANRGGSVKSAAHNDRKTEDDWAQVTCQAAGADWHETEEHHAQPSSDKTKEYRRTSGIGKTQPESTVRESVSASATQKLKVTSVAGDAKVVSEVQKTSKVSERANTSEEKKHKSAGNAGDPHVNPSHKKSGHAKTASCSRSKAEQTTNSSDGTAPHLPHTKEYWKSWNKRPGSLLSKEEQDSAKNRNAQDPYLGPAEPLPLIPEDSSLAIKGKIKHQVQIGKAAAYFHLCARPEYLDSMNLPYAVFTFKYRSKETLERKFGMRIEDDNAAQTKARLADLSKEQLVEEVLNLKSKSKSPASARSMSSKEKVNAWDAGTKPARSEKKTSSTTASLHRTSKTKTKTRSKTIEAGNIADGNGDRSNASNTAPSHSKANPPRAVR